MSCPSAAKLFLHPRAQDFCGFTIRRRYPGILGAAGGLSCAHGSE